MLRVSGNGNTFIQVSAGEGIYLHLLWDETGNKYLVTAYNRQSNKSN